nr:hypothetical protein B0A51_04029 [Rachicladosporium sp. CCFEE 5018]
MANNGIAHSIVAISAPGADVYLGDEKSTIALARLLNEYLAALARTYPKRFTFYAAMPLPYSQAALKEANHATILGAVGIGCLSNHEGHYLGTALLTPFFAALNARDTSREIIYVHPTEPVLNVNGSFISANPTQYPSGNVEYYFEAARTIVDLTITQTILNYTKLNFVIPHVGGAFPAVEDRFIKSYPALEARAKEVYRTRFWWDSAGPTYFAQVKGLLGYGVPTGQLLFGTDYPCAPLFTYGPSIAAIVNADFINRTEKAGIFSENAKTLFGSALSIL